MDFVGKTVKKELKGFGILKSYDPLSGFFEIEYEDGDSEKLGSSEVSLLLQAQIVEEGFHVGRKPKKRQKVENRNEIRDDSCDYDENLVNVKVNHAENLEMGLRVSVLSDSGNSEEGFCSADKLRENLKMRNGFGGILKESLDFNGNLDITVDSCDVLEYNLSKDHGIGEDLEAVASGNWNLSRTEDSCDGFDLNAGLNLNDGYHLHLSSNKNLSLKKKGSIDLNLDASADFDENLNGGEMSCSPREIEKGECDFDLNMEIDDANEDSKNVEGGELDVSTYQNKDVAGIYGEKELEDGTLGGNLKEDQINIDADLSVKSEFAFPENATGDASRTLVEQIKKDNNVFGVDMNADSSVEVSDAVCINDSNLIEVELKDAEAGTIIHGFPSNSESQYKKPNRGRKRRKLSDNLNPAPETILRRSTRRASAQNHVLVASCAFDDPPLSSIDSEVIEEKQVISDCGELEEPVTLPPKLELPPSSQKLNLDDVPVLDIFSIYTCLRSFSTLLFLSPFELEDFVAALKCKSPTTLFDNIHVSVLRTLRKHLEYLSTEGSESASTCLRSLNWDFLDLITWPIFMVEYLLIHGSGLKPGFDLTHLKLFKIDYYRLPTSVKVEILRCLCDDMIEVEAIRSEINRRSLASDPETLIDKNVNFEVYKKKKASVDVSGSSCLTEEVLDESNDRNSDECCLCKMDGSLICCDGCPAAYHSKCVGIANDLLPEGDWYCPECASDRYKPWMRTKKSSRGAELLGIDPHGRLYFSSCGYLLVSNSCESESSFNYYHRNDLDVVIEVLRSSYIFYGDILIAICRNWNIPFSSNGKGSKLDSLSGKFGCEVAVNLLDPVAIMDCPDTATEESALTIQTKAGIQNFDEHGNFDPNSSFEFWNKAGTLGNKGATSELENGNNYTNFYSFAQIASSVSEEFMRKSSDKIKVESSISEEEITAGQMKAILKKTTKFYWPIIRGLNAAVQREKCGWCFSCKYCTDERNCLFNMTMGHNEEGLKSDVSSFQLSRNSKGHLTDVMCCLLSIVDRLRGLLLGPWLNPDHSKFWHKSVLKAFDLTSMKRLLFAIESNLHHRAISSEWPKHADSVVTLGSSSHIITPSARACSKNGIGRKKARNSDNESNPSLNAASGLGMLWWRGGRLSRKVFSWKVLPRSMASKAARQAGCRKIPGILYNEGSEYAKRSRFIAWRAAVETSTSVEQLAFQVRELDSNIRWDDIENSHPLPTLDKDSRKSVRLFKKVIIRRKSVQRDIVKYLLDFGKRRVLPDVVKKHGTMIEDSSSERKKYWLDQTNVPLYLWKNFEEKRIARKSNEAKSAELIEVGQVNGHKKNGFAYLFSKAERSEFYQCGHCSKDVSFREAVSCQYCNGFFHKRHVKKLSESITAKCTYACHRFRDATYVEIGTKREKSKTKGMKMQSSKYKKASTDYRSTRLKSNKKVIKAGRKVQSKNKKKVIESVPLRRSTRIMKCLSLQDRKQGKRVGGGKKRKKMRPKKAIPKKQKRGSSWQKKRSPMYHSYWLNGLLLSRKPSDERVVVFQEKNFFAQSRPSSVIPHQPKCHFCSETRYTSGLNYIACEICAEWFHGDAFGLDSNKIHKVIGFRCHTCRKMSPPVCPHLLAVNTDESVLAEELNDTAVECEEATNAVPPVNEILSGFPRAIYDQERWRKEKRSSSAT